jgi:hypothetical protein
MSTPTLATGAENSHATAERLADLDRRWAQGVGRKVRGRLAERGKSQHDAGVVLGLSQNAISRRVRGELCFTMAELGRLSLWLQFPIGELLPHQDSNLEPAGYRRTAGQALIEIVRRYYPGRRLAGFRIG